MLALVAAEKWIDMRTWQGQGGLEAGVFYESGETGSFESSKRTNDDDDIPSREELIVFDRTRGWVLVKRFV
jgi:hypothetical protein